MHRLQLAKASRGGQCEQAFVNKILYRTDLQDQNIPILYNLQVHLCIYNSKGEFCRYRTTEETRKFNNNTLMS